MDSVTERIDLYKHKYNKVNNFTHKNALVSLVTTLEFYLGTTDKEFQLLVKNDDNYQDRKYYNHINLMKSFNRFMDNNYELISDVIEPYKSYLYRFIPFKEEYVEPNKCLKIVGDFLLRVDPHLYNMFCLLYTDNRILFKSDFNGGLEFNEKDRNSIHILVGTLCSVSDMATLVHELGHAYKDYLIPDYHRYYDVNSLLCSEISSKTLELMFLMYLIKFDIYKKDATNNFNCFENVITTSSKQILETNNYNDNYIKELSYLLGGILANNFMINDNINYSAFIRYIYLNNIKTILKDLNKESIVKKFHF